jgi:predicted nucleotidyltransferase
LFGSCALNTAVKGTSDIDILLELDYTQTIGMKFFSFQRELEELLHNKADVVISVGRLSSDGVVNEVVRSSNRLAAELHKFVEGISAKTGQKLSGRRTRATKAG